MNRREFMTGAFGLAGVVGAGSLLKGCAFPAPHGAFGGGTPNLRFGVLSDIHLKNPGDEKHLLNALRYFRDHGADGVLVAGDIADTGRIPQLKMLADAWYSVFPGDRRPDAFHPERFHGRLAVYRLDAKEYTCKAAKRDAVGIPFEQPAAN